ncbi:MAG: sulfotransferase [Candidatus Wenzhouxiangella sp. M2_3B_020]
MTNGGRAERHVPGGLYWKTRFFSATAGLWKRLAAIETAVLRDELPDPGNAPIYVAGVARSGTTILTEMIARHPDVTCHRYSDFPNVHTPFWRNWLAERTRRAPAEAVERAHRDRLMVTAESPEAVEEVIWMRYFDHLHDAGRSQVMGSDVDNPAFEAFYREHVAKLLLARGRSRYLTKGNYNTTRLGYIRSIFPEARFVVPVRRPLNHVASLVKQDRLFRRSAAEDPRVTGQLHRSGHFEFGPDKRCIHVGDDDEAAEIHAHWQAGRDAEGWAMYWNAVYRSVLDAIDRDEDLAGRVLFVRYEALCARPTETIDGIVDHCRLPAKPFESVRDDFSARLSEPDYYAPDFSEREIERIHRVTAATAGRLGYSPPAESPGTNQ